MINLVPILTCVSITINLIILIVTACCFVKIMKNDLTHVQKDLLEIKEEQKESAKKVNLIAIDVSYLKGKLCNKRKR